MLLKLSFLITLVILGIFIERKYIPRFQRKNGELILHYSTSRGARNQVNLSQKVKSMFK